MCVAVLSGEEGCSRECSSTFPSPGCCGCIDHTIVGRGGGGVHSALYYTLYSALHYTLFSALHSALCTALYYTLYYTLYSSLHSVLYYTLYSALYSALYYTLYSALFSLHCTSHYEPGWKGSMDLVWREERWNIDITCTALLTLILHPDLEDHLVLKSKLCKPFRTSFHQKFTGVLIVLCKKDWLSNPS